MLLPCFSWILRFIYNMYTNLKFTVHNELQVAPGYVSCGSL